MAHIEQIPSYLTWKIRHKALYPDSDFKKAILENDDEGMHLGLFDENQLRSVVSLFKDGTSLQFRKFATLPDFQNKGYGSELLAYLLGVAAAENYARVWCNARTTASGFYQRFGFRETDQTFSALNVNYVIMEKISEDNTTGGNSPNIRV